MDRWICFLDIEGFANHYKTQEMRAWEFLRGLMSDVFRLGRDVYPRTDRRVFAHQMIDGFLLCFNFGLEEVNEPLHSVVALMHSSLSRGCCLKCSMVRGGVSDVQGMYPDEVMNSRDSSGFVRMGDGVMTISYVFGEGSIDAYKLGEKCSGPVFLLRDVASATVLEAGFDLCSTGDISKVDWLRPRAERTQEILSVINRSADMGNSPLLLERYLKDYPELSERWVASANSMLAKGEE